MNFPKLIHCSTIRSTDTGHICKYNLEIDQSQCCPFWKFMQIRQINSICLLKKTFTKPQLLYQSPEWIGNTIQYFALFSAKYHMKRIKILNLNICLCFTHFYTICKWAQSLNIASHLICRDCKDYWLNYFMKLQVWFWSNIQTIDMFRLLITIIFLEKGKPRYSFVRLND